MQVGARKLAEARKSGRLLNPLSANFTKWSNTLKQFVGKLQTNCLSVFDHFVRLALKGLMNRSRVKPATLIKLKASKRY